MGRLKCEQNYFLKESVKSIQNNEESIIHYLTLLDDHTLDVNHSIRELPREYLYVRNSRQYYIRINLLTLACVYGKLEAVKYLLEVRNVRIMKKRDYPLFIAMRCNHPDLVDYLLQVGFDPNYMTPKAKLTAKDMIRKIHDKNMIIQNLYAHGYNGEIIFKSVKIGAILTTRFLLNRSPNLIDYTDYDGRSLLMIASKELDIRMVRILLEYGADINCKRRYNSTESRDVLDMLFSNIIHYDASQERILELLDVLFNAGGGSLKYVDYIKPIPITIGPIYQSRKNEMFVHLNEFIRSKSLDILYGILYSLSYDESSHLFNLPPEIINLIVNAVY